MRSGNKDVVKEINVSATRNLNQNNQGRPSPLYVRVFQLNDVNYFNTANFNDLRVNAESKLGQDLLAQQSFILQPEQDESISIVVKPETQYIAFFGDYAQISQVSWNMILERRDVTKRKPARLSFSENGIHLAQD